MKLEVLIAGFGGQGVLLMGQLLAEAALRHGLHATWFPSYGPEMRGGTANCSVCLSDEEIGSPIASRYDVVIAMNQPSLEKFVGALHPGGLVVINQDMVPVRCQREDVQAVYVAGTTLAAEAGSEKAANVVMLGALLMARPVIAEEPLEAAVKGLLGAKKPELLAINLKALAAGRAAAKAQLSGCGGGCTCGGAAGSARGKAEQRSSGSTGAIAPISV